MQIANQRVDGSFFQNLKTPAEFIFIRHGESEGNFSGIFQGLQEFPLTERGREQARIRGRQVRTLPFCSEPCQVGLYASPLGRARETAELIAEFAGFSEPNIAPILKELDTGIWTGKSWVNAKNDDSELWSHFQSESWAAIPEAESEAGLYARAFEAWTFLRDQVHEHALRSVIAVTHGGFLQWLFKVTQGCMSWFPLMPAHNCGMFCFKVEPYRTHPAYIAWETIDEDLPSSL